MITATGTYSLAKDVVQHVYMRIIMLVHMCTSRCDLVLSGILAVCIPRYEGAH